MPDLELPTFFRHRQAVLNVIPDDKPATWGLWDLDGCIGEINLAAGTWNAKEHPDDDALGPYPTWESAISGLLDSRRDTLDA